MSGLCLLALSLQHNHTMIWSKKKHTQTYTNTCTHKNKHNTVYRILKNSAQNFYCIILIFQQLANLISIMRSFAVFFFLLLFHRPRHNSCVCALYYLCFSVCSFSLLYCFQFIFLFFQFSLIWSTMSKWKQS